MGKQKAKGSINGIQSKYNKVISQHKDYESVLIEKNELIIGLLDSYLKSIDNTYLDKQNEIISEEKLQYNEAKNIETILAKYPYEDYMKLYGNIIYTKNGVTQNKQKVFSEKPKSIQIIFNNNNSEKITLKSQFHIHSILELLSDHNDHIDFIIERNREQGFEKKHRKNIQTGFFEFYVRALFEHLFLGGFNKYNIGVKTKISNKQLRLIQDLFNVIEKEESINYYRNILNGYYNK